MDFLLLYHFRKLKGVAIEILQELVDDITTNMIFEILAIKFLSEIEKYLAMATLIHDYINFNSRYAYLSLKSVFFVRKVEKRPSRSKK